MKEVKIIDITPDNILEYGICGYKSLKREGFPEKVEWIKDNYTKGLRIKSILTEEHGVQGMIEYIPGEYGWRPVDAKDYLFIHCLFVGFKKIYKGKGYASSLIDESIKEAKKLNKAGVAVVTRKSSFMAGNGIFLKNRFKIVDKAEPDFELLVLKFDDNYADPKFKSGWQEKLSIYKNGLYIIRSGQCPYTQKNVKEIVEVAEKDYGIKAKVIENKSYIDAQQTPCAFGTFTIIYNGEVISHHPISSTRFKNIMNSINN